MSDSLNMNVVQANADFENYNSKLKLTSTDKLDDDKKEDEKRDNWGNRVEFLLACIGYSVGLGNIWRFGYLCAKSGGGAFLIPYFINLVIVAIPLTYMEFSVGQFTQKGPIGAMAKICPLLKGTGIATVVLSFFLSTYYIVIITWAMYYIFASFASDVPWKTCGNEWNTDDCWDGSLNASSKTTNNSKTPSEEFYRNKLLGEKNLTSVSLISFEDFGMPKLDLLGIVVLAWIIVYFCIWKGVKSTGKVVYVTALLPYVIILIFLVRGVTLDGAWIGLEFFFIPKWEKLGEVKVWVYAAIQNFNSIGVAFGGLISMSSFNKQNKPILGNVLTIALADAFTSIICGTTVFSVLGYIAKSQSKQIDDILEQGPGLVFMVLPEAIRNMSPSPLWAVLFFAMIFMLGIDSQFTMVETVVTAIDDEFNFYIKKYLKRKEILVLLVCIIMFCLCLPNICPGGIFYFTVVDFFSAGISLFYIALFEVIAIAWIYGGNRLARNVKAMNGYEVHKIFVMCWYVVSPLFIFGIWIFSYIEYTPITYANKEYTTGPMIFGWCIALVSIIAIPAGACHTILTSSEFSIKNKILKSLKPTIPDIVSTKKFGTFESNGAYFKNNKVNPDIFTF